MHDYTKAEIDLAVRYHHGQINETQFNYLLHTTDVRKEKVEEILDHLMNRSINGGGALGCLCIIVGVMIGTILSRILLGLLGL